LSKQYHNPIYRISALGHYHECLLEGDTNNIKTAFPDLKQDPGSLLYLKKDTETSVIGGKTCHPNLIQPTISLEMPVPSQGHYGFHSFPVVD
jgi:hypothetical protein